MIVDFPTTLTLVTRIGWGQQRAELVFPAIFAPPQTIGLAHPRWTAVLTPAKFDRSEYSEWESILLQMEGFRNRLALWHLDRPTPRGTMRGAMVLVGAHAQGATTLRIHAAGQGGKTLLTGDHIGLGVGTTQQVCKLQSDAEADVNGYITVDVHAPLRSDFADASVVTWDKPKALFRRTSADMMMDHLRGGVDGTALDLIEDWNV
jgi:hypothetical protein